jgi:hypothetical protein
MITEISWHEAKHRLHIFPNIRFENYNHNDVNYMNFKTYIEVDGYLVCLIKQYSYNNHRKLNYVELMKFMDGIMPEINKIKKNFKPELFEKSTVVGIYKIKEDGFKD